MIAKNFLKRKTTNFNFFFCFLSNTVFINREHTWHKMILPSNTFCSLSSLPNKNSIVLKFFTNSKNFWSIFWKLISVDRAINIGFFAEMELIGLGFRIKKIISTVYRFFWGHANYTYLFVPGDVLIEYSPEDRFLFFFGLNAASVRGIVSHLMLLRKLSRYRVTGFVQPGKIIRLNSGKQR